MSGHGLWKTSERLRLDPQQVQLLRQLLDEYVPCTKSSPAVSTLLYLQYLSPRWMICRLFACMSTLLFVYALGLSPFYID
jgi:hypothetical protein